MSSFFHLLEQYATLLLPFSFTILALFFASVVWRWSSSLSRKRLPPSPPRLPIIGNLHQIGLHPHRSLQSLAQTYGPLMLLYFGNMPVLVVSSADTASLIMKTHDLAFANRPKSSIFEKLLYDYKDVSMAPYGEYWRQMKSICILHLLSNKRVKSFRTVREEETSFMIEKIIKSCSSSSSINLSETLATVTNDIVCRVALGRKYSDINFKELLADFVGLLGGFNVGDYIPWLSWVNRVNGLDAKVERVAKELDNFLDGVMEEHRSRQKGEIRNACQGEDSNDFVDVLLRIQKENTIGLPIDGTSIKALILDTFAAGTDTTYTVLEWAMTELLRHTEVMKKLQNEVREIANDKTEVTEDDLEKMNYLKAVIKETLRMHPPIPLLVPRESTQDVKIQGFDIAAGIQVFINAWTIGRDPEIWDRAEEFWPDRFLNSSVDFRGHHFQLIPFGAGRRSCPGTQFAISTDELVLANLLHKFEWELPDRGTGFDLSMSESTGLTIHKKFPLIAIATPCSC